jgi:SAM-dependent methyltransferase
MTPDVSTLFDAMAADYDVLEPWYEHLYARLHAIVRHSFSAPTGQGRALDAGCGTGFQAAILADLGWNVHGVDLAGRLLDVARDRLPATALARATLEALPYAEDRFDAVVCVGSTLSFVEDPARAVVELGRVLRPGGRLLLECEHRFSLDLGWALLSALTGDRLGYGLRVRDVRAALAAPRRAPVRLRYPGYGLLTLFTRAGLRQRLAAAGLVERRAWGIHSATNLLPSTLLHRARLPRPLAALDRALRVVDSRIEATAAGRALGNSLVLLAEKPPRG